MGDSPLASPLLGETIDVVVDWLELQAFFAPYCASNISDVIAAEEFQIEDIEEDIGERDRQNDDRRLQMEKEIESRAKALGDTYPFSLSEDGAQLMFASEDLAGPAAGYLLCLILSHITQSPILASPPNEKMVRQARKRLFQVFATLAAAGHAQGGAVSLGWPREKKESIIDVVNRASTLSGTGEARAVPNALEPKGAKDGGLDVLAWKAAVDGPPAETFYFVQAASGLNWKGKSARDDYKQFLTCYYLTHPTCNLAFLTVCPYRLNEDTKTYHQISHGTISDRTRAPKMAQMAMAASLTGIPIDEVANFPLIPKWVARYRRHNRIEP